MLLMNIAGRTVPPDAADAHPRTAENSTYIYTTLYFQMRRGSALFALAIFLQSNLCMTRALLIRIFLHIMAHWHTSCAVLRLFASISSTAVVVQRIVSIAAQYTIRQATICSVYFRPRARGSAQRASSLSASYLSKRNECSTADYRMHR